MLVVRNGLDGGDQNLGALPVAAAVLINSGVEIGLEVALKVLFSLLFQLEAVNQKEHAPGVAGAQKELDDGGGHQGFTGAGGHFEQKAVLTLRDGCLHGMDGVNLIGAQELEAEFFDEFSTAIRD